MSTLTQKKYIILGPGIILVLSRRKPKSDFWPDKTKSRVETFKRFWNEYCKTIININLMHIDFSGTRRITWSHRFTIILIRIDKKCFETLLDELLFLFSMIKNSRFRSLSALDRSIPNFKQFILKSVKTYCPTQPNLSMKHIW